jgi:hypothetical protein
MENFLAMFMAAGLAILVGNVVVVLGGLFMILRLVDKTLQSERQKLEEYTSAVRSFQQSLSEKKLDPDYNNLAAELIKKAKKWDN